MATQLIKHADVLVTMDAGRREIRDGAVFSIDGVIDRVGRSDDLPKSADLVVDLSGHVAMPGLINTHHHLFQTLTRALPAAQNASLFGWLKAHYPVWMRMTPEHIRISTLTGLAELMLSGCTTSSDHLYLFPNGARLDDEIEAAQLAGVRFHAMRGGMSIGESQGGLPPDAAVENEQEILADCERLIASYHDPAPHSLLRVGVAPCSPFSVSRELMRESAALARRHGVRLHTHLAENDDDVSYSLQHFGCRPGQYAETLGWTGADVWHAHCVKLDTEEIDLIGRSRTGIAHCPTSNMRLASGIAPVRAMLDHGVRVGLGVDGSASNDCGHLLLEARQAMLLQRVASGVTAFGARAALELATRCR
ncbi:MAG: 8-oxoguanine deaminase, partial [Hyphomicrobiaceae bacterium]